MRTITAILIVVMGTQALCTRRFCTAKELDGAELQRVHVEDGTLYFEDGSEVALWGVNFQTCMSGEHRRIARSGQYQPLNFEAYKVMIDANFDDIELMGCDIIRIHLGVGDFTDGEGNLIENGWLDLLDYTLAECCRRGIYINLAFLNHWGRAEERTFVLPRKDANKWQWMVAPKYIAACETYMRQLVNRKNPRDHDRIYKRNPAFIIAEMMNEPTFPQRKPVGKDAADCGPGLRAYESWRTRENRADNDEAWQAFKEYAYRNTMQRYCALMEEEEVEAVPCWNLLWSQGPRHQGPEPYEAAAASQIELVSFSTYPGQGQSKSVKEGKQPHLNAVNFLPYLQQSYDRKDWQGWLRTHDFRGKRARIVYEYETWHNRSTYMYPAMAKYFRAQGAQAATMWTYTFSPLGPYMRRGVSHHLSLRYTPRKAASFLVAREVFRRFPRYGDFTLSQQDADEFGYCALSLPRDLSAYSDDVTFIHSGDVTDAFIPIPRSPRRIIGYGSSPFVTYEGTGLYFLERGIDAKRDQWRLRVLHHFEWLQDSQGNHKPRGPFSRLTTSTVMPMTLRLPGLGPESQLFRCEGTELVKMSASFAAGALAVKLSPGQYVIK